MQASDGQPPTGSPYTKVFMMIITTATTAIKQNSKPTRADIVNGTVENEVIPSRAYLNNLKKLNFEVPDTLSGAVY